VAFAQPELTGAADARAAGGMPATRAVLLPGQLAGGISTESMR
jgi:hypothetical protein